MSCSIELVTAKPTLQHMNYTGAMIGCEVLPVGLSFGCNDRQGCSSHASSLKLGSSIHRPPALRAGVPLCGCSTMHWFLACSHVLSQPLLVLPLTARCGLAVNG
jgi:hypothetical protein